MSGGDGPPPLPRVTAHWRERFHALMPFRVREILLVSSAYDAFLLEEDGPIGAQLFTDYSELNLSWVPRITHAPSIARALEELDRREFQLVLTVARLEDGDPVTLSQAIRERHANLPVALLLFDETDLSVFPSSALPAAIDYVFLWTGDASILVAAVKLIEDAYNVEHDVHEGGVQSVLVVEDQVRSYSKFLSILYPELLSQSQSLIAEGLNDWHRLMRMTARPKILLARSYEEALFLYERWHANLMAIISDIRFPQGRVQGGEAGLDLARHVRASGDPVPLLFVSSEEGLEDKAREFDAWFARKDAHDLQVRIRHFLAQKLGFGDFIFLTGDGGQEVGRVRNIYEMEQALRDVPAESIEHHARRHDFSAWLKARSMFQIAEHTRQIDLDQFESIEGARQYLLRLLEYARSQEQEGVVTDSMLAWGNPGSSFIRVGSGSLGGKGRGIGFISSLVAKERLTYRFPELRITVPRTVAVGADEFDRCVQGSVDEDVERLADDAIRRTIVSLDFPPELVDELRPAVDKLRGPIAVRSSSLLEDSRFSPFAGVYETYMLPNNHPDPEVRFGELCQAMRAVYASKFSRSARTYIAGLPHTPEEEKMAVVIQELVGRAHGDRFYPHISGVAQSYNYYPVGGQRAEDGIATIALGLGQYVAHGSGGLRFSPRMPTLLPQFPDAGALVKYSQKDFYALDLSNAVVDLTRPARTLLGLYDLSIAEEDGTMALAGSVYSAADDVIRDNLRLAGPRVVTFNNVLKWNAIPLCDALCLLLDVLGQGIGTEVEMEFAVDMGPSAGDADLAAVPSLYVLQVRPMVRPEQEGVIEDFDSLPHERIMCRTDRSLGNGCIDTLTDIVYVSRGEWQSSGARGIAEDLRVINEGLQAEDRRYLLIGPGRWGTSDLRLGIPVEWPHISCARVIIETSLGSWVEPSQGTHFFHNVTSARVGYLTVLDGRPGGGFLDWDWLDSQEALTTAGRVRHIRLDAPLTIYLDGRHGRAAILRAPA